MKRRSKGLYEFLTPPAHYRNMSARFRLLTESGRCYDIACGVHADITMVSAQSGAIDYDEYLRWSPRVYHRLEASKWSPDYWMLREASFICRADFLAAERVYKSIRKMDYVPVSWTGLNINECFVRDFARRLILCADRNTVPLFFFAVRNDGARYVLYAHRNFLETFRSGQDILNYHRMAVGFKKVYGFE